MKMKGGVNRYNQHIVPRTVKTKGELIGWSVKVAIKMEMTEDLNRFDH